MSKSGFCFVTRETERRLQGEHFKTALTSVIYLTKFQCFRPVTWGLSSAFEGSILVKYPFLLHFGKHFSQEFVFGRKCRLVVCFPRRRLDITRNNRQSCSLVGILFIINVRHSKLFLLNLMLIMPCGYLCLKVPHCQLVHIICLCWFNMRAKNQTYKLMSKSERKKALFLSRPSIEC